MSWSQQSEEAFVVALGSHSEGSHVAREGPYERRRRCLRGYLASLEHRDRWWHDAPEDVRERLRAVAQSELDRMEAC
jgi:hypothetical protein